MTFYEGKCDFRFLDMRYGRESLFDYSEVNVKEVFTRDSDMEVRNKSQLIIRTGG